MTPEETEILRLEKEKLDAEAKEREYAIIRLLRDLHDVAGGLEIARGDVRRAGFRWAASKLSSAQTLVDEAIEEIEPKGGQTK
jgi:hypothetical protein